MSVTPEDYFSCDSTSHNIEATGPMMEMQVKQNISMELKGVDMSKSSTQTASTEQVSLISLGEAVQTVVKRYGGVRATAKATGITASYISRLMRGHKLAPSDKILRSLGIKSVTYYKVLAESVQ